MRRAAALRWETLLLIGWILAISVARAGRLQDTDPYWQVVAGREVLAGTPLVRPDSWSWAPVGGLFYPNSPAWNVALARAWDLAGSWGMFALAALVIAAYLGLVAWLAHRLGAGPLATIGGILLTSLLALPMLSPRATVAAQMLLMAALAVAVEWARRTGSHRPISDAAVIGAAGFAFSGVGNWIHLSWSTLAFATALSWAALWLLWPGIARANRWALTVGGTAGLVAGILVGPYGTSVFDRARVVLDVCRGLIVEWSSPFTSELAGRSAIPSLVALGLTLWATAWCVRRLRASRTQDAQAAIAASLIVVALPAAFGGLVAIRFVGIAVLTIAPMTAVGISLAMRRLHARFSARDTGGRNRGAEYTSEATWRVLLTLLLGILAPFTIWYAWPHSMPDTAEATYLLPRDCRLFAQSDESAAVILLRPDVTVWLDGRAEYWGRPRLEEMNRLRSRVDPENPVPAGATCVLLPPVEWNAELGPLTAALDGSPQWERIASTRAAVVWALRSTSTAP